MVGKDSASSEDRVNPAAPHTDLAPSFGRQSVLAVPVLVFSQQDGLFHSLLRVLAPTAPFAWKEFPPDNCKAAFLTSFKSLLKYHHLSGNFSDYSILKCHLCIPYHPSLLYFSHSTYYYLAWYIFYLLALSMSQLEKHVCFMHICLFTSKF